MINYFDFYGLPVKFNLDEQDLKTRYFNLLKTQHPDFFIHDPEKYKEALLNSSLNNEAYQCLSDFKLRAYHLITLSGVNMDDSLSQDFLMAMMDINEALDDLHITPDPYKFKSLENEILTRESALNKELSGLSKEADTSESMDQKLIEGVKQILGKLKYILRLKETLANIAAPK